MTGTLARHSLSHLITNEIQVLDNIMDSFCSEKNWRRQICYRGKNPLRLRWTSHRWPWKQCHSTSPLYYPGLLSQRVHQAVSHHSTRDRRGLHNIPGTRRLCVHTRRRRDTSHGWTLFNVSLPWLCRENWGHHAPQNDYIPFGPRISRLLTNPSRLGFACELIDDSSIGLRRFRPCPALTVLVYFRLEVLIKYAINDPVMSSFICAIRYRDHIPVFLLVEGGEDWHDDGRHKLNVEYSSHRLEGNEDIVRLLAKKGITVDLGVDDGELMYISVLSKCEGDRHSPVLKLLDEFGATYNPENITSYTPLMLAVIKGDGVDVWKERISVEETQSSTLLWPDTWQELKRSLRQTLMFTRKMKMGWRHFAQPVKVETRG